MTENNATQQPTITTGSGRVLPTYPAAVLAYVIDEQERILMLSSPNSNNGWEPPNGAMDADETPLQAAIRELAEEAGPDVRARPLGVCHAVGFAYDQGAPNMISLSFVFAYAGGAVEPGDDMRGSKVKWATVDEIESHTMRIIAPRDTPWVFRRAVECYRLWKDAPAVELQPPIDAKNARPKYSDE